jgi:GT2 family glycosyltransferase
VTDVTAIVLAYGDEPHLRTCVEAVLASTGIDIDVVLVDNGCTDRTTVDQLATHQRVRMLRPDDNLGYAGGCNLGADNARGDVLAFVNSDAIVEPDALAELVAALDRDDLALATASVRLADEPELLNAAGNPLNILGVAWAGHFREPAAAHAHPRTVTLVSGATFCCRRTTWAALGGFDPEYFAYHEDTELSVRCWQRGWRIGYVPAAVVRHHYEFSRNPRKFYLVERNRWFNLLTLWQMRTLILLAPALLGFELAMLALATRQRWLRQKLAGYSWLWQHREHLQARRRRVQAERRRSDRDLAELLTPAITAANIALPAGIRLVNVILGGYWAVVRRFL